MSYKTIVFAGPSAIGKTYAANELMRQYPGYFEQAKLYTTRPPRPGENSTDRIFVDKAKFIEMARKDLFVVHDEFGGNMYGFTKDSLYPKDKHLLVNAWPWLIPQFSALEQAVIVGLQAPDDWQSMLVERMKKRGDNQQTIQKRLQLIIKDSSDLLTNKSLVNQTGKYFTISDDEVIPRQVLPWIADRLNLTS